MNLETVAIYFAYPSVHPSSSLPSALRPILIRLSRDSHTHDLKARKLARLPADKCRREQHSFSLSRFRSSLRGSLVTCVCACTRARMRVFVLGLSRGEAAYTYARARTHSACDSALILLEATDAPISARVSFVIRENVNQSPGLCRLLLFRASPFFILSRMRVPGARAYAEPHVV